MPSGKSLSLIQREVQPFFLPPRQWGSLVGLKDSAIMEKLSFEEFRRTELEPLYAEIERSKAEQNSRSREIIDRYNNAIEQNNRERAKMVADARLKFTNTLEELDRHCSNANKALKNEKELQLNKLASESKLERQRIWDQIEMKRTRFLQEGGKV